MLYQGHIRVLTETDGWQGSVESPTIHLDSAIHGFQTATQCEEWAQRAFAPLFPNATIVAHFMPLTDVYLPDGWSPTDGQNGK